MEHPFIRKFRKEAAEPLFFVRNSSSYYAKTIRNAIFAAHKPRLP